MTAAIELSGEIISYEIPSGTKISHADLKAALLAAGFEEGLAKDMQPRNAFSRAAAALAEARIIRKLSDDTGFMRFQFTREEVNGSGDQKRLNYNYEAVLTLNKRTGEVTCPDSAFLAGEADRLIRREMDTRKTGDISRILFVLFGDHADVFPVRSQGGCYFVPAKFSAFLTQVETLLAAINHGCSLRRFPVPKGYSPAAERSIKESVDYGFNAMIDAHLKAVSEFEVSTRPGTMQRMAEAIKTTRFKIEVYAEYLGDKQAELLKRIEDAKAVLREKCLEVSGTAQAVEPAGEPAVLNAA